MPKVSIIIPTYNRASFISESIISVLNQSFDDLEIIIIDDGSIDNTSEIINKFSDKRIKYFYQSNRGIGAARNEGIRKAQGEYIAFQDSGRYLVTK